MMIRTIMYIACLLLVACVQAPVFRDDSHAYIRSNYPVVNLNGDDIEPGYEFDLPPGENTLVITYHTYRHNYDCTFNWNVEPNNVYEVTDQDNRYPLTLYRWVRRNSLWAARLDPVEPVECVTASRK